MPDPPGLLLRPSRKQASFTANDAPTAPAAAIDRMRAVSFFKIQKGRKEALLIYKEAFQVESHQEKEAMKVGVIQ